jgi:hypothetical protein
LLVLEVFPAEGYLQDRYLWVGHMARKRIATRLLAKTLVAGQAAFTSCMAIYSSRLKLLSVVSTEGRAGGEEGGEEFISESMLKTFELV